MSGQCLHVTVISRENRLVVPQETKRRTIIGSNNSTPRYTPKSENRDVNRHVYANVHSSMNHSPERGKQFKCPSAEKAGYTYRGILFSLKEE